MQWGHLYLKLVGTLRSVLKFHVRLTEVEYKRRKDHSYVKYCVASLYNKRIQDLLSSEIVSIHSKSQNVKSLQSSGSIKDPLKYYRLYQEAT